MRYTKKQGPPVVFCGEFKLNGFKCKPTSHEKAQELKTFYKLFGYDAVVFEIHTGFGYV